jgi:signal transduction histidine kinase
MGSTAVRSSLRSSAALRSRQRAPADSAPQPAQRLPDRDGAGARTPVPKRAWPGQLCAAAARLQARADLGSREFGDGEARREIATIADACCRDTELIGVLTAGAAALRCHAVAVLRAELVRGWSLKPAPATDMVQLLEWLEAAHAAAGAQVAAEDDGNAEHDWTPDLPELAVEVAHDMRSPLSSILFLAELLHRDEEGRLSPVQRRQLGIIYGASLSLVGLTNDMVELTYGSRMNPVPLPFSVNEVLAGTERAVRPLAEQRGLSLDVRVLQAPNRLGCSLLLGRVLLNLTTNALKFTQEGGVVLSAREVGGQCVEFSVRDTGAGIPAAALGRLYAPFRVAPARPGGFEFSGTGLGLAMCRRLVEAMGSKLEVMTGDWGTRFSFRVDLPPASAISSPAAAPRSASSTTVESVPQPAQALPKPSSMTPTG